MRYSISAFRPDEDDVIGRQEGFGSIFSAVLYTVFTPENLSSSNAKSGSFGQAMKYRSGWRRTSELASASLRPRNNSFFV